MPDIHCYAYAEDELSCAVLQRLVQYQNQHSVSGNMLRLNDGFPENKRGSGNIKRMIPAVTNMARAGIYTILLTDLDNIECPPQLIRDWFGLVDINPTVPSGVFFRVAEREIESWLIADRGQIASFLGIAQDNFTLNPDSLPDPKQHLLNIIQAKGRRRFHKDMLPGENARIGPMYNPKLTEFVIQHWDPERAKLHSQSLHRTLKAFDKV
jgi:hypothetical protein